MHPSPNEQSSASENDTFAGDRALIDLRPLYHVFITMIRGKSYYIAYLFLWMDSGNCFLQLDSAVFKHKIVYFGQSSGTSQKGVNGDNDPKDIERNKRQRSIDYPPFYYDGSVELKENQNDFSKVIMCLNEEGGCTRNITWTNTTGANTPSAKRTSDPDPSFENFFSTLRKREARKTRVIMNRAYAKSEPFENGNLSPPILEDLSPPRPARKDTFWISTSARFISFVVPYVVFPYVVQFLFGLESLSSTQLSETTSKFSPGVSILYGTFVSLTLSILYNRQQRIQDNVSNESALLAMITRNFVRIFRDDRESLIEAGQCVADQIRTLVKESRGGELMVLMYSDPYARMLELVEKQEDKLEKEQGNLGSQGNALGSCRDCLKELVTIRSSRLSDEALALPRTHFFILQSLTSLIVLGFIITTLPTVDTATGLPSNESSLLFALLCSIYVLFYNFATDLNDAFGGIYQVRRSTTASSLLQTRWLIVNHPILRNEVDFEEVDNAFDGRELLMRTPGLGDMYFLKGNDN